MSFPDLGLSDGVFFFIRIIATIGGAVVGWFLCDPLTRGIYWLWVRAATPGALLFTTKSMGATILAVLIYVYMPLGGGGGLGWGPGLGGGPGKGPGPGGDKSNAPNKDGKPGEKMDAKAEKKAPRSVVEIQILGGAAFTGDDRYFLVKKGDPALKFSSDPAALKDLEATFKDHHAKIEIVILLNDDSTQVNNDNDPTRRLQKLASKYDVPSVVRGP